MVEAREALFRGLPWWVLWARPVASLFLALFLVFAGLLAITHAGRWLVRRRSVGASRERAQAADQVRGALRQFVQLIPPGVAAVSVLDSPLPIAQRVAFVFVTYKLCLLIRATLQERWEAQVLERRAPLARWRDWGFVVLTLVAGTAYVASMPQSYDARGLLWLGVGCVAILLPRSAWGLRWLVAIFFEPPRQVCIDAVGRAAAALRVPVPRVVEVRMLQVNAFALREVQVIGFTTAAVDALTERELELIAGHELGHLHDAAGTSWRRLFALRQLALVAFFPICSRPSSAVAAGLLVWFLLGVWERAEARAGEHHADSAASSRDEMAADYGRALQRTYQLNLFSGAASTHHPSLDERLRAVAGKPKRANKKPKQALLPTIGFAAAAAALVLLKLAGDGAASALPLSSVRSETALLRFLAVRADANAVLLAGSWWLRAGRLEKAKLASLAAGEDDLVFESQLLEAAVAAANNDCREARADLAGFDVCDPSGDCDLRLRAKCWRRKNAAICDELVARELPSLLARCGDLRTASRRRRGRIQFNTPVP